MKPRSNIFILLLATLVLGFFSCQSNAQQKTETKQQKQKGMFKNLDAASFEKLMNENADKVILDVRTPAELADGSIDGHIMININEANFIDKVNELDKNKPVFVYCRSGGRSSRACMMMADLGFNELYNLEGGIGAWNVYKGK